MDSLVFLEPNKIDAIPFTTSKVISDFSGVAHRKVKITIRGHEAEFKSIGLLALYGAESTGGRPEEVYRLNEPQASFLMTLLKNTPVVVAFKLELVKQFYAMRAELQRRQIAKFDRKPIRRELTDVIQSDPNHSKWDYKLYTDLAYKTVLGKNAVQIRKERGAKQHDTASDYMTATEIEAIARLENQISAFKEFGMDYYQIKGLFPVCSL